MTRSEGPQMVSEGRDIALLTPDPVARTEWRLAAAILGWLMLAGAAVELVVRQFNGEVQLLIVLAVLAPYALIPAILGTIGQALARSRLGLAVGAVIVALTLAGQAPPFFRHGHEAPAGAVGFTVLTGNMRLGLANATDIVQLAASRHADAVTLQELTPAAVARLTGAGLDREYPYSEVASGPEATGVGLWSKFPISDEKSYTGFTFHEVSAKIAFDPATPNATFTLFSTHVVAPWPGPTSLWVGELERLAALLGTQSGTTVDAGDFNSTLDLAQFRQLLAVSGYADAGVQSGAGLVRTFPTDTVLPPLLGIDHVLTKGASTESVHTVALPNSDHRGLVVHLYLPAG